MYRFASTVALLIFSIILISCSSGSSTSSNSAESATSTLSITPSSVNLAYQAQQTFTVTGGTAPYTFTVVTGGAGGYFINGVETLNSYAVYTAPSQTGTSQTGTDVIMVQDSSNPQQTGYADAYISSTGVSTTSTGTVTTGSTVNDCHTTTAYGIGGVELACDPSETYTNNSGYCADGSQPAYYLTNNTVTITCNNAVPVEINGICCASRIVGDTYTRTIAASGAGQLTQIFCGPGESANYVTGACINGATGGAAYVNSGGDAGYEYECVSPGLAQLSIQCTAITQ